MVKKTYGVGDFEVNMVSMLFLITFLPGMLLSTFVFDKFGLRAGIVIGAVGQGVGAATKYFINHGFWIVLVGQTLMGLSQPFLLDSPALVATVWFEDSLREIVITLGANFNIIGIAIGFIFPTFFVDANVTDVDKSKSEISLTLLIQGIICVFLALLTIFTFQNKPKTPPSANAEVEREDNLLQSYK